MGLLGFDDSTSDGHYCPYSKSCKQHASFLGELGHLGRERPDGEVNFLEQVAGVEDGDKMSRPGNVV